MKADKYTQIMAVDLVLLVTIVKIKHPSISPCPRDSYCLESSVAPTPCPSELITKREKSESKEECVEVEKNIELEKVDLPKLAFVELLELVKEEIPITTTKTVRTGAFDLQLFSALIILAIVTTFFINKKSKFGDNWTKINK